MAVFQPNITEDLSGLNTGGGSFDAIARALADPNVINALSTAGAGFSAKGRGEDIGVGEILSNVSNQFVRNKAFQGKTEADTASQKDIMAQVLDLLKGGSKGFSDAKLGGPTKATIDGNQVTLTGTANPADTNEAQEIADRSSGTEGIDVFGDADIVEGIKANQPQAPTTGGTEISPFGELPVGSKSSRGFFDSLGQ